VPPRAGGSAAIRARHVTSEDAGEIFARANPRMAVFTHIPASSPEAMTELVGDVRERFDGPLVIGEDRMRIEIGDQIRVVEGD